MYFIKELLEKFLVNLGAIKTSLFHHPILLIAGVILLIGLGLTIMDQYQRAFTEVRILDQPPSSRLRYRTRRTPTPTPRIENTPTPTIENTPTPTPRVENTPTPTIENTPTPTGINLLLNGDFSADFDFWKMDCTDCWGISEKPPNPLPNNTAAQCDQDLRDGDIQGWPIGLTGRLWQDITTEGRHSQVTIETTEIQHHGDNVAQWRLYGYQNRSWIELWSRPEFGTDVPEAADQTDWYTNQYTIPVSGYSQYRLEALCRIDSCIADNQQCGWKFSLLHFETD